MQLHTHRVVSALAVVALVAFAGLAEAQERPGDVPWRVHYRAKQLLGRGHEAKAPLARARELAAGATPREQSHIAIFEKILTGQAAAALEAIREHMKSWPRDAMALAPATSVFGLIGFSGKVGREVDQLAVLGQRLRSHPRGAG